MSPEVEEEAQEFVLDDGSGSRACHTAQLNQESRVLEKGNHRVDLRPDDNFTYIPTKAQM
jgi:hypothetical protein